MSATHFITIPTFHRKRIFQNQRYGELLTETLMHLRQEFKVLLHDYVIMPDHVHLLLTTYGAVDATTVVRTLQTRFANELTNQFGYSGELWEPAIRDHQVLNADDCTACVRQIHSNPVRGGFCEKPTEYQMSSPSSRWVLDPLPDPLREAQSV